MTSTNSCMVSVLIPNYNHARYLRQRIDSVLNQTFQDFELIILDDCSKDDSRELIEQYRSHPKVAHLVLNERNSGSTFIQWQKGLDLAKGEWIWIAESDDLCEPQLLEKLLAPDIPASCGLRYCISEIIDGEGARSGILTPPGLKKGVYQGIGLLHDRLLDINIIPNASGVLVRKELLRQVVNENVTQFRLVGDWLVWCLIALQSDVYFTDEARNFHRQHEATVRHQLDKGGNFYEEYEAFRRIMDGKFRQLPDAGMTQRLMAANRRFHFRDEGYKGCYFLKTGRYGASILPLMRATFQPKFTLYYLKSALYWLRKGK